MTGSAVERQTPDSTSMGRRQVRGSALLVAGRVLSMVLGVATQVLIVRALSKADYGAFAYALALSSAGSTILSLGQGKLLSRFMAMYDEQKDYARMFGAMFLAIGTIVVTSVLGIGAMFAFQGALIGSAVDSSTAVNLVLILVFVSPLEALDLVFVALFAVFSKPRAIFFRKFVLAPGLRLTVVLLLIATNASVSFLAIGYLVASVLGISLYLGLLVKMLRDRGLLQHFSLRRVTLPYRAVFAFSFPLITGELALLSLNVGGVLVLGAYQTVVQVAYYRAVFNSARLNTAVTGSFATLFLPAIARLYERSDIAGLRRTYWHTALFAAVLTFPIFALTGPMAPETTIVLFGARYSDSVTVLGLLSLGYYLNVVLGFNAYTLQVCGRIRYLVLVNVSVFTLNIGLSLLFAPRFGAAGVAGANCIALVTQNLFNQWALRSCLQSSLIERTYWRPYLLILGLAVALWGFQRLLQPNIIVTMAAVAVASLYLLFATRRGLELAETFPELRRLPLLGRLVG